MRNFITLLGACLFLVSCANNNKRIYIMSKGPAQYNESTKTISAKDGNGHEEKIVNISAAEVALKLDGPSGEANVSFKENGLYVINIKNDTIIGSKQNYISTNKSNSVITQDDLKHRIDSLYQLTEAKNISASNHNFFILPNQAVKISDNLEAIIVGPFHQMTTAAKVDGVEPEVYRFYSIREIRETIQKLEGLTKLPAPTK